jgi:hypothetical protein
MHWCIGKNGALGESPITSLHPFSARTIINVDTLGDKPPAYLSTQQAG